MKIFKRNRNFAPPILAAMILCMLLCGCGAQDVTVVSHPARNETLPRGKVVFLAGPDSHLPGEHEHKAGSQLLSEALRKRLPGYETVNVYGGWPTDESIFNGADAVVLYCDGGDSHLINDHLATFRALLQEGVGIIALHYCVELPKGSPAATAMQAAIGGYFETWWSVNPTWTAEYRHLPEHPVTRGVHPFTLRDEWYFNMRFADVGVTPILRAIAPASTMDRWNGPHSGNDWVRRLVADGVPQVTAWAYERPGGGRGFGYTGGHWHSNWDNPDARALVLNAIEWVSARPHQQRSVVKEQTD